MLARSVTGNPGGTYRVQGVANLTLPVLWQTLHTNTGGRSLL